MNIQGWKTALADEELASDQAVIDLMFLSINESVALAKSREACFKLEWCV